MKIMKTIYIDDGDETVFGWNEDEDEEKRVASLEIHENDREEITPGMDVESSDGEDFEDDYLVEESLFEGFSEGNNDETEGKNVAQVGQPPLGKN
ncbi:hypothetical protein QE152_g6472 [Popillia japonica]|uniref:Uncharacterized protein n=1 Tax=Popillia japonica TaxID=7064 RepID=A0AAW1MGN8_POPJA